MEGLALGRQVDAKLGSNTGLALPEMVHWTARSRVPYGILDCQEVQDEPKSIISQERKLAEDDSWDQDESLDPS